MSNNPKHLGCGARLREEGSTFKCNRERDHEGMHRATVKFVYWKDIRVVHTE